jgi:NAD-dependent dihydropyrimidine dehydrogenase PreA subunit
MRLADLPAYVRDTMLRMLPHRAPTGLVRIGSPDRDSPVLLTGNFTLTVRRLRDVLRGRDAWLLCANSRGINVWCAAGGGHLTHHDVISVLRTSGVLDLVEHRDVVLPQLCATGVERRKVSEATGWKVSWGPARLEDLPAYLDRGRRVAKRERFMRFPLWERLEMGAMWGVPMAIVASPFVGWLLGARVLVAVLAAIVASVGGTFALVPWLPLESKARWLVFPLLAAAGALAGAAALAALSTATTIHLIAVAVAGFASMAVLSVDISGTTPWFPSTINTLSNEPHIDLVEERCTGASECVLVCPRDVLQMAGKRRKVEIKRPEQCIECGACIVQCPEDALRFRYDDGSVVEPETIRTTRMNMLGKRTVVLPRAGAARR